MSERWLWDETKNVENQHKHGIDLASAELVFAGPVLYEEDTTREYDEVRWLAYGYLRSLVVAMVFVEVPEGFRVISLRKASRYERRRFERYLEDGLGKAGVDVR